VSWLTEDEVTVMLGVVLLSDKNISMKYINQRKGPIAEPCLGPCKGCDELLE
jgi:hypothetical protein